MTNTKLDTFTQAYIEAAFWSSTLEPFGECASCGKDKPLVQFDKDGDGPEWTLCANCAGGAGTNNYEPPMDENYSVTDLAPETLARMVADCAKFQEENAEWIDDEYYNKDTRGLTEQAGHDFWLTRNGHGAGFWDGDWLEPASTKLTDASKAAGECSFYVGDDGKVYGS